MNASQAQASLCRYYGWHARIYDQTRWGFLFGRAALLKSASAASRPDTILEIGCGTGTNLRRLARLNPGARLHGIDISPAMLAVARRKLSNVCERIDLRLGPYEKPLGLDPAPDLIVVSYCLSMINPGWENAISTARVELAPGGCLAVVDFHGSPWSWYRRWMGWNHVRMQEHLLPHLEAAFPCHRLAVRRAFGGLWRYFQFLGFKRRL